MPRDSTTGQVLDPELMSLIYSELRAIARRILRGEHDERSLGATGLVHEAVGRLLASEGLLEGDSPARILALTTRVMGHVLIDRARQRRSLKRGGAGKRVELDDALDAFAPPDTDFEELYEAIEGLRARHESLGRAVVQRYVVGLSNEEIARAEGIGVRAVEARLQAARGLLRAALAEKGQREPGTRGPEPEAGIDASQGDFRRCQSGPRMVGAGATVSGNKPHSGGDHGDEEQLGREARAGRFLAISLCGGEEAGRQNKGVDRDAGLDDGRDGIRR